MESGYTWDNFYKFQPPKRLPRAHATGLFSSRGLPWNRVGSNDDSSRSGPNTTPFFSEQIDHVMPNDAHTASSIPRHGPSSGEAASAVSGLTRSAPKWLQYCLWIGLALAALYYVTLEGDNGGGGRAAAPPNPLHALDSHVKILQRVNSVVTSTAGASFSKRAEINSGLQSIRDDLRRCRYLSIQANQYMGSTLTRHIQDCVTRDNCTSALPVTVRESQKDVAAALGCADSVSQQIPQLIILTEEASSRDSDAVISIEKSQKSRRLFDPPNAERSRTNQRDRQTAMQSLEILGRLRGNLSDIGQVHSHELQRLNHLSESMFGIGHMCCVPQDGTAIVHPQDQIGESRPAEWKCHDLDIQALKKAYLAMASSALQDEELANQFYFFFDSGSNKVTERLKH